MPTGDVLPVIGLSQGKPVTVTVNGALKIKDVGCGSCTLIVPGTSLDVAGATTALFSLIIENKGEASGVRTGEGFTAITSSTCNNCVLNGTLTAASATLKKGIIAATGSLSNSTVTGATLASGSLTISGSTLTQTAISAVNRTISIESSSIINSPYITVDGFYPQLHLLNSTTANTPGYLTVGYQSSLPASLNIQSGSVLKDNNANLGVSKGTNGSVTVDGANWNNSGYLTIATEGTGFLSVADGGAVSTKTGATIGFDTSATGFVLISPGSQLTSSGYLTVGYKGTGHLNILGGKVSDRDGTVGAQRGSNGSVAVGPGSWNNTQDLTIGSNGDGTLSLSSGGQVFASGIITGKTGEVEGGGEISGSTFENLGTVKADLVGTPLTINNILELKNAGNVFVDKGAELDLLHSGLINNGIVKISPGGTLNGADYKQESGQTTVDGTLSSMQYIDFSGGSVFGNGGELNGNVLSNSAFNLGDSTMQPGLLSITGDFTQGQGGTLKANIGGREAGFEYGQLSVEGKTVLNGGLMLSLINGFVPRIGDQFLILRCLHSLSGEFRTITGQRINSKEYFKVGYTPYDVEVEVVGAAVPRVKPFSAASPIGYSAKHTRYRLIDMGRFGGTESFYQTVAAYSNRSGVAVIGTAMSTPALSTNNRLVCGGVDGAVSFINHAFQWLNGTVIDLGALPGETNCSNAVAANADGEIVGNSEVGVIDPLTGVNQTRAVYWKDGQITPLGTFGGNQNGALGINNSGQIVGFSLNTIPDPYSLVDLLLGSSRGTETRAFLFDHAEMQDLGTLGGNDAVALFTNGGKIAGYSYTNSTPNPTTGVPTVDPFLWEDGGMRDLGTLGGNYGFPIALNTRGQVIGQSNLAGDQTADPFLWEGGKLIDMSTQGRGGSFRYANAINDNGEIAGAASFTERQFDAALWNNGVVIDLGTLDNDCGSEAFAINAVGQVGGTSVSCDGVRRAFLWQNGVINDLNALVPADSPLQLVQVLAISDRGEIAGVGVPPGVANSDWTTQGHAFLLIPCGPDDHEGCQEGAPDTSAIPVSPAPNMQRSTIANQSSPELNGATNPMRRPLGSHLTPWNLGSGGHSPTSAPATQQ